MNQATIPSGARRVSAWKIAAASAALLASMSASAAPIYLVDATTNGLAPDPGLTNVAFSFTFEDFNMDMKFALNELLAFTGFSDTGGNYFDQLLGIPTVPGFIGNGTTFRFGDSTGVLASISFPAATFTPFSTDLSFAVVPEPTSLALVALAFAGLGLARRRTV